MNCEQIVEQIPGLIRREIMTDQRTSAINHIRSCAHCRSEYLRQLKIFYTIDKNLVVTTESFNLTGFKNDLQGAVQMKQNQNKTKIKWYFSAVATLIILSLTTWFFLHSGPNIIPVNPQSAEKGIKSALEKEDWPYLQKILISNEAFSQHANEQIPLRLLIEKLQRLDRTGIDAISFNDLFDKVQDTNSQSEAVALTGSGASEIRIDVLIKSLKAVSPYTKVTSLKEISNYLEKNKPGGTDS